jgi:hypothetical protein
MYIKLIFWILHTHSITSKTTCENPPKQKYIIPIKKIKCKLNWNLTKTMPNTRLLTYITCGTTIQETERHGKDKNTVF